MDDAEAASETAPPSDFDVSRTFVRVIDVRDDGFVEFAFAIGDPELEVELLMHTAAFEEFCAVNDVEVVDPDRHPAAWGLHDARTWASQIHDSSVPAPTYGDEQ